MDVPRLAAKTIEASTTTATPRAAMTSGSTPDRPLRDDGVAADGVAVGLACEVGEALAMTVGVGTGVVTAVGDGEGVGVAIGSPVRGSTIV